MRARSVPVRQRATAGSRMNVANGYRCRLSAEADQAEGMPCRVAIDPEALPSSRKPPSSQGQHLLLSAVDVGYRYVQMHLLRAAGVGPLRRLQVRRHLEGQPGQARRITDDHPVTVILHPLHAEQFLIEGCQTMRIRAVDHKSVPPSDHSI